MIPDGNYYSNVQSIQYKNSENDMQVTEYDGAPVYRHYRNNVANTMLSMAMGIIFTGVACIAIGHFLGEFLFFFEEEENLYNYNVSKRENMQRLMFLNVRCS